MIRLAYARRSDAQALRVSRRTTALDSRPVTSTQLDAKITPELLAVLIEENENGASLRQLEAKHGVSKTRIGVHIRRERKRRQEQAAEVAAERRERAALEREQRAAEPKPPEQTPRELELRAAVDATTPGTPEHTTAKLWLRRYLDGRPRMVPLPSLTGQAIEPPRTPSRRPRMLWDNPHER